MELGDHLLCGALLALPLVGAVDINGMLSYLQLKDMVLMSDASSPGADLCVTESS